jgi:hypothetical protein
MKKSFIFTGVLLSSFFTLISSASAESALNQADGAITTLGDIVTNFTDTLGSALGQLAMAAGVIAFFYGVVQYIWGVREADPKVIKTGNQFMIWGLVGLFVMFSVYGIIKFAQTTLFPNIDLKIIEIPEVKFKRGSGSGLGTSAPSDSTGGVTNQNPLGTSVPAYNPTTSSSARLGEYCNRDIRCGQGTCSNSVCVSNAPVSTQSEGNAGECVINTACRTADDSPGLYDSSCVCQLFVD